MPLDQVNKGDEILDHVHVSIYFRPIYYQLIQDKLTDVEKKRKDKDIKNENMSYTGMTSSIIL